MDTRKRILITGIGVVSVIGDTLKKYWQNLLDGISGISKISAFDAKDLPCRIAGQVHDFDPVALFGSKESRRMPRCGQMALAAALDAVADAGLPETMRDPERVGVCMGTAMGGQDFIDESIQTLRQGGYRKVSPFTSVGGIPNFPAFLVGKQFQALGPNSTIATACATGTQAIGE
ncbi:MAG: hypothetical protein JXB38_12240, partial [Anaerolineales bacterium]|nr:hypothetical protein [Anaerolineales bacterium]